MTKDCLNYVVINTELQIDMLTQKSQRSEVTEVKLRISGLNEEDSLLLFPAFCFPAESDFETAPPVDRVLLFFVETLSAAEAADAADRF